jgi:PTH1 family peptidyl-tRNA hydrolase
MIKLVVGLGNPGDAYKMTRHNIGFILLERYVEKRHGKFAEQKQDYQLATLRIRSLATHFCKPMTFMNLSGEAVTAVMKLYQILPSEILAISDDFALPFGKLRLRLSGSSGGHNGLESIVEELGTEDFPRLRMGIGPVPDGIAWEEFVLQRFSDEELDALDEYIKLGIQCLDTAFYKGLSLAMNQFNSQAG